MNLQNFEQFLRARWASVVAPAAAARRAILAYNGGGPRARAGDEQELSYRIISYIDISG